MLQWNLKELREAIRADRSESEAVLDIVHSIDRYIRIFLFHLYGARDALDEVIDPNAADPKEALAIVLGASERQEEYHSAKVASEAHILGAAHSARAMFDVFAFLVNSLVLSGAIPESRCSIQLVVDKLPPSPLKHELEALTESYWFGYVSAFVNVAKHRMLASHSFHVGFDDPYTGIRVGAFEYKGTTYPPYKVREFLEGVLEVKNKIVDCGALLNNQVVRGGV
ncbi:hypothetical protein RM531_03715 [Salinisphaera sp. P385]|uniref:RiboL-PSP-HEPN domain-containing protein n=1 Tax=Spectribacter acetivorans TaxID=3075603 RepID=A0ABU3B681_9GAMM|nr:hypothetical protein [Salinisphaera sp. P385]MDT0617570.1 hypothetical protein [Salinisphaera sp. P385]